jgi:hypothetical protein
MSGAQNTKRGVKRKQRVGKVYLYFIFLSFKAITWGLLTDFRFGEGPSTVQSNKERSASVQKAKRKIQNRWAAAICYGGNEGCFN